MCVGETLAVVFELEGTFLDLLVFEADPFHDHDYPHGLPFFLFRSRRWFSGWYSRHSSCNPIRSNCRLCHFTHLLHTFTIGARLQDFILLKILLPSKWSNASPSTKGISKNVIIVSRALDSKSLVIRHSLSGARVTIMTFLDVPLVETHASKRKGPY